METLEINRGEWLTGVALKHLGGHGTLCHAATEQMCCLGFLGQACGLSKQQLKGHGLLSANFIGALTPEWLTKSLDALDAKRFTTSNLAMLVEDALATVNDGKLHPKRKEAAIKYLFAKYGDTEVVFTGSYAAGSRKARTAAGL